MFCWINTPPPGSAVLLLQETELHWLKKTIEYQFAAYSSQEVFALVKGSLLQWKDPCSTEKKKNLWIQSMAQIYRYIYNCGGDFIAHSNQ